MVTKEIAKNSGRGRVFYHATARNSDGTATRCRVNGVCQTWKTRPDEFRLPVKYGLKQCFYITEDNSEEWLLSDPTIVGKVSITPEPPA